MRSKNIRLQRRIMLDIFYVGNKCNKMNYKDDTKRVNVQDLYEINKSESKMFK